MDDGEIRIKIFTDGKDIAPTLKMAKDSVYHSIGLFERYCKSIVEIIFGNAAAKEAIAECERLAARKLHNFLDEELGEDEDLDAMLVRLVKRFEVDENGTRSDKGQPDSDNGEADVKTELFAKGDAT